MPHGAAKTHKKSLYGVHPGVLMVQKWIDELPQKTGKSLDEWITLVKKSGPATEKERREWLMRRFNFGTNAAWWIAERAEGKGLEDGDPARYLKAAEKYVAEMFAGPKNHLRPLYDALLKLGLNQGRDVKACPCKTIVPLYRNHVFAEIKPATQTRIDLGFALKDMKPKGRLVDTGGFSRKDRITHRIPMTKIDEVDDEVRHWMKAAYELDA